MRATFLLPALPSGLEQKCLQALGASPLPVGTEAHFTISTMFSPDVFEELGWFCPQQNLAGPVQWGQTPCFSLDLG